MTIINILLGTAIGAICYCLGRWGKEDSIKGKIRDIQDNEIVKILQMGKYKGKIRGKQNEPGHGI